MTVLVTGARGKIAQGVLDGLRAVGKDVLPATRPGHAADAPDGAVEVDFTDPASAKSALDGVSQVFLYASPAIAQAFTEAADTAGVEQVVLLSSAASQEGTDAAADDPHAAVEHVLATGRFATTFLQPGAFMNNALRWIPGIQATGEVRQPYLDASEAPIDELDIVDVAVRVLLDGPGGGHDGSGYLMSGPEALTRRRQIELVGEVTGVPVRAVELTPGQWRAEMSRIFGDSTMLDALLAYWRARLDSPPVISDVTERILGRPARTPMTWLQDNKAAFTRP
jgi:uncharacterized protein YbjT (DUF2867 family)